MTEKRPRKSVPERPKAKAKAPRQYPDLLFVPQGEPAAPNSSTSHNNVLSHARRWQIDKKHRDQKLSAQKGANYARSLVGWRSTTPSSPGYSPQRSTGPSDSDLEESKSKRKQKPVWPCDSKALSISLSVAGGLRNDPFNAFPSASNTKEVMHLVDYYIHVFSPHKAGRFDVSMGFNANLDLCWPIAMQDDMLFDATIAVSRVAWCISVNIQPADDQFMLCHRGAALARLRQRVMEKKAREEEVIFTMARMLSISYMSNEFDTFKIHFRAFREAAERYINSGPETVFSKVIGHRLKSWSTLYEYRTGANPLLDIVVRPSETPSREKSPSESSVSGAVRLPGALNDLVAEGQLSTVVTEITRSIFEAIDDKTPWSLVSWIDSGKPLKMCTQLLATLTKNYAATAEFQVCCALIAICLQIQHMNYSPGALGEDPSSNFPVRELAEAFINKKITPTTTAERNLFTWCSMNLGCLLLMHYGDLRGKGHIILLALQAHLSQSASATLLCDPCDWSNLEIRLRNFVWHDQLAAQWEQCWESVKLTQLEWEQRGFLSIGRPKRASDGQVDMVEYMVLREARDSLPPMDSPVIA